MINKRDRYHGALVGVLAGDSLGAPYETWDATRIKVDLEKRGGLVPFDYPNPWSKTEPAEVCPRGRPTDDADHTAALAQSLIECEGVDQRDIFYRLRMVVFDHVSPLWSGQAFGAGKNTRNALRPPTWQASRSRPYDETQEYPSNGSVMRCASLALFFGSFYQVDDKIVDLMTTVTHRHPIAIHATRAQVLLLSGLLDGISPVTVIRNTIRLLPESSEVEEVLQNCREEPRDPESWPGRGAATLTLHVALWSLLTTSNFRDGITKAVSIGGDTDTYAAVAGALLGAYYGYDAIPQEWRDVLLGRKIMESIADRLYEISG